MVGNCCIWSYANFDLSGTMIINKKHILENRFELLKLVREFFWQKGFLEVETPLVVASPDMEPTLTPLETAVLNEKKEKFPAALITSPEYAMKKLLAAGFEKIFQICKCFRNNEPFGLLHNPEFTMIEWYRVRNDYKDIMRDVEELFNFLHKRIYNQISNSKFLPKPPEAAGIPAEGLGTISNKNQKSKTKNLTTNNQQPTILTYQENKIDVSLPWERISVCEAFKKYAGIDLKNSLDVKLLGRVAEKKGYTITRKDNFSDVFFKIFLTEIEKRLGKDKPTFIYDYPIQMAALARPKKTDPRFAERFELYIAGREIANAFSELTDSKEQLARIKNNIAERKKLGKTIFPIDYDFIEAVGKMPPSAGIALGLDRLFMILLDVRDINDIIPFPASKIFK